MILIFAKLVKCSTPHCFNPPAGKQYKMCEACMRAEFVRLKTK